jgi:DNA-binding transcriptional ArsR family regulator
MDANLLSALAEPNRLRIIELLREQPYSVGEIAERLLIRQPQVSKHLRVLSEAGLVKVHPSAQQRIYQLQPTAFLELDSWLGTFRRIWNTRLDNLGEYLQELKQAQDESQSPHLDL